MNFQEILISVLGGGSFVLIVQHLLGYFTGRTKEQNEHDRLSRESTRKEFQELYDRQQKDIMELQKRDDTCRDELSKVWRWLERASMRIEHYENELLRNKIPFRPWVDPTTSPSKEHKPLGEGET